jgi:hypothetical protein
MINNDRYSDKMWQVKMSFANIYFRRKVIDIYLNYANCLIMGFNDTEKIYQYAEIIRASS